MAALASVPAASTAAPSTPAATSTAVTNITISTATPTQPILWNVCLNALPSTQESNDPIGWVHICTFISMELAKIFSDRARTNEPGFTNTNRAIISILVQPDYEAVVQRLIQEKLPTLAASSISVHTTTMNNRRFDILMTGTPPAISIHTFVDACQLGHPSLTDDVRRNRLLLVSHLQPQPPSTPANPNRTAPEPRRTAPAATKTIDGQVTSLTSALQRLGL